MMRRLTDCSSLNLNEKNPKRENSAKLVLIVIETTHNPKPNGPNGAVFYADVLCVMSCHLELLSVHDSDKVRSYSETFFKKT